MTDTVYLVHGVFWDRPRSRPRRGRLDRPVDWHGAERILGHRVNRLQGARFQRHGLIAAGIILNIMGNTSQNQGLAVASLPVIGLGLVLHVVGIVVRGQQIRRNLKQ
ncbi:hypothetical protein AHiyo6_37280 [Arthrobacter sp. Hiyo6]|nr:hypothetical protein AHiyo6_37280 [Arthrobacter sp. Hiyo6]